MTIMAAAMAVADCVYASAPIKMRTRRIFIFFPLTLRLKNLRKQGPLLGEKEMFQASVFYFQVSHIFTMGSIKTLDDL